MIDLDFANQAENQAQDLVLKTNKQIDDFLKSIEEDTENDEF